MRARTVLAAAVILIFAAFAVYSFREALTPYVGFAEAARSGRTVQVWGQPVETEKAGFDRETGRLHFHLEDRDGVRMPVIYTGTVPRQFWQAESIVVIGEHRGDHFAAHRMLVRCPSKYVEDDEGAEEE